MNKKPYVYFLLIILSIILVGVGFLIQNDELKAIQGICIGVGTGLFGASISNVYMIYYFRRNPEALKAEQIELNDERNMYIRYRAKAKASDITKWLIVILAAITIILNYDILLTLALVVIYLLNSIFTICYTSKYNKTM